MTVNLKAVLRYLKVTEGGEAEAGVEEQQKEHRLEVVVNEASPQLDIQSVQQEVGLWFRHTLLFKTTPFFWLCRIPPEPWGGGGGGGGGEREGESQLKKTAKLEGPEARHPSCRRQVLEPLKASGGYACQSDGAVSSERGGGERERERGNTSREKKEDMIYEKTIFNRTDSGWMFPHQTQYISTSGCCLFIFRHV